MLQIVNYSLKIFLSKKKNLNLLNVQYMTINL